MRNVLDQPEILENTHNKNLLEVFKEVLPYAKRMDIATGYFEIGSLLLLDGIWQKLSKIRIVMSDEMTGRTMRVLSQGMRKRIKIEELDRKSSRKQLLNNISQINDCVLEEAKENSDNEFETLRAVEAILHAIEKKIILPRIYTKHKFHAKAYLFHLEMQRVCTIGSSNFTAPGLTKNVELNTFSKDTTVNESLEEWYEKIWDESETVRQELLKVLHKHTREFTPFEVWLKSIASILSGKLAEKTNWDKNSELFNNVLSKYQQDGYLNAKKIADEWGGAFICDGVGLGKTFIGLMLLEFYLGTDSRVLLLAPAATEYSVWRRNIDRYLKQTDSIGLRQNIAERLCFESHSDLSGLDITPEGNLLCSRKDKKEKYSYYRDFFDIIIIDEGHHFRNTTAKRSRVLRWIMDGKEKKIFFLTATPINNSMRDMTHLINYIARDKRDYFKSIGIPDFFKHFRKIDIEIDEKIANDEISPELETAVEEEDVLRQDELLSELVIKRSRRYVMDLENRVGGSIPLFPKRDKLPVVLKYSLKSVYPNIYEIVKTAFSTKKGPYTLKLAIYSPDLDKYRKIKADSEAKNRNKQIVGLIRILLLKRMESSWVAFETSLENILIRMASFIKKYDKKLFNKWVDLNSAFWNKLQNKKRELYQIDDDFLMEDDIQPLENLEYYKLDILFDDIIQDMNQLSSILCDMYSSIDHTGKDDDKFDILLKQLKELEGKKVVIFTMYTPTARYLQRRIREFYENTFELDSNKNLNIDDRVTERKDENVREIFIKRFAPYYNCDDTELDVYLKKEIDILISTDVLSEGLNLQDCSIIINYDLHWNPVQLMQRIGRVDRRLDPDIEKKLGRKEVNIEVFNFLPPVELDDLLNLYKMLTGKILKISRALGIESHILTGDDPVADSDADPEKMFHNFNAIYEGKKNAIEELNLKMQDLKNQYDDIDSLLKNLPHRIFSGRRGKPIGIFACYELPNVKTPSQSGEVLWYFYSKETGLLENRYLGRIMEIIEPKSREEKRYLEIDEMDILELRKKIDIDIKKKLLNLQASRNMKAILIAWLAVN